MATTYENMVLRETHKRELASKRDWGNQHGSDIQLMPMDTAEFVRLEQLRTKVSDLCDLQPTPANMVRPERKVWLRLLWSAMTFSRSHPGCR
jgi:hypothetical protein